MSYQAFAVWLSRAAGIMACLACSAAWAQLPASRLNSIFPPGGTRGSSVEVTIAGTDLDLVEKLHFSHPGLTAVPKTRDPKPFEDGPQPIPNVFVVTIASDVPPGTYDVRAIGKFGISNARIFAVSDLPEAIETEPNDTAETAQEVPLGVVNARSNRAADVDWFKFNAKAGQRLIIQVLGQRIDSPIDASITLFDAQGQQIDADRDTISKDPLIDFTVPADGTYVVKVNDFVYAGGNDHVYRLQIADRPYIDFVYPNAAAPGSKAKLQIYGRNLPGGQPTDERIAGRPLQKLEVTIDVPAANGDGTLDAETYVTSAGAWIDGFSYRLKSPQGDSNPVLLGFTSAPVVLEQEPNQPAAKAQTVTLPCEFVGRFQQPRDVDYIQFEAKQGQTYWIEAFSQRFGLATDPYLLLQRVEKGPNGEEKVTDIREIDDTATNVGGLSFNTAADDPSYSFTVPANGTYRLLIRDLYYSGDPRFVYRVAIRPAEPDFRLVAIAPLPTNQNNQVNIWSPLLRRGGRVMLNVLALRREGFTGPIEVSAEGLPPGVSCPTITIGPSQNSAPLVFTAAEDAKKWAGAIRIVGKAKAGDRELVRVARGGAVVWPGAQNNPAFSRITREVALAVSEVEEAPFTVQVGDGKPLEMSKAGSLEVPVKVTRRGKFNGNVNLQAMGQPNTVQVPSLVVNGNQNEATLKINIQNNAPPEPLTFYLLATTQVDYARNAELVPQAQEYQKKIDGLAAEADKAVKDLTAAAKTAADAKAAADKAVAEKTAALKAAEDKLKAAEAAAAKEPEKTELAQAKVEAAQAVEAAKTALTQAQEAAKAAAAAATAAEQAKVEAENKAKALQAEKAAAAKAVADRQRDATVKKVNVFEPSTAVVLNVTPAPIKLKELATAKVRQGEKAEVTVAIERLYGYADPVTVEVTVPGSARGVKVARVTIEKDKSEAKLAIEAEGGAAVGSHNLPLKATARFNNQNLEVTGTVPVTVEAAAK